MVIIQRGSSRVELLELAHWADVESPRQLRKLLAHCGVGRTGNGTLVEYPSRYRHMSSERRTSRSALDEM